METAKCKMCGEPYPTYQHPYKRNQKICKICMNHLLATASYKIPKPTTKKNQVRKATLIQQVAFGRIGSFSERLERVYEMIDSGCNMRD